MSDEVELDVGDLPVHGPTLENLGGDQKVVNCDHRAHELIDEGAEEVVEVAEEMLRDRRERLNPSADRFQRELSEEVQQVVENKKGQIYDRVVAMERRIEKEQENITDPTEGPTHPAEDAMRQYCREPDDVGECADRIDELVRDGSEAAARALFRDGVPPGVAGFHDAEHRARKKEEWFKLHHREEHETINAISKAIKKLEEKTEILDVAARKAKQEARATFNEWASS